MKTWEGDARHRKALAEIWRLWEQIAWTSGEERLLPAYRREAAAVLRELARVAQSEAAALEETSE
jgi:hypothetical protein